MIDCDNALVTFLDFSYSIDDVSVKLVNPSPPCLAGSYNIFLSISEH